MKNYRNDDVAELCKALLLLETPEECCAFLEDICTIKEMQELAQRLATARMLDRGVSYQKISEKTGVSTATISRVSRALNYGSGGYRLLIDRLNDGKEQK